MPRTTRADPVGVEHGHCEESSADHPADRPDQRGQGKPDRLHPQGVPRHEGAPLPRPTPCCPHPSPSASSLSLSRTEPQLSAPASSSPTPPPPPLTCAGGLLRLRACQVEGSKVLVAEGRHLLARSLSLSVSLSPCALCGTGRPPPPSQGGLRSPRQ